MQIPSAESDSRAYVFYYDPAAIPKAWRNVEKSTLNGNQNNDINPIERGTIHRIKARKAVLDDEISFAQKTALSSNCATSVFCELVKLAKKQVGCLIDVDEGEIKYEVGGVVKFFSVRSLRKRLARAAKRDLH